ncbi:MAG TPA: 4-hydroxy-tetrahydrodipicolinate synthase [Virgibacillus sp.]|nr:4-hydroxy-tetrahydrodipicolinate synthase [Virgibacillus sp.]
MDFGRVLTAMVTPFNEQGEVDRQQTKALVNYLLTHGSDGIIVAGTTGESPTLTTAEKVDLFHHVVDIVGDRGPVIAGTGSNNTKQSIELTKEAERAGVDGIMLVTPYYNKPSQKGLYEHFKAIAQSTHLPIMLYNIPGRSATNLDVDTTIRLANINNIVSVKDASGDLNAMSEIIRSTPNTFSLYSGDDQLTLPVVSIGGQGIVSVSSHIIGEHMQEMIQLFLQGEVTEAAALHRHLLPVMNALFAQPSPSPVKAALNMKGIHVGGVRLPLVGLTAEETDSLKEVIQQYNFQAS